MHESEPLTQPPLVMRVSFILRLGTFSQKKKEGLHVLVRSKYSQFSPAPSFASSKPLGAVAPKLLAALAEAHVVRASALVLVGEHACTERVQRAFGVALAALLLQEGACAKVVPRVARRPVVPTGAAVLAKDLADVCRGRLLVAHAVARPLAVAVRDFYQRRRRLHFLCLDCVSRPQVEAHGIDGLCPFVPSAVIVHSMVTGCRDLLRLLFRFVFFEGAGK